MITPKKPTKKEISLLKDHRKKSGTPLIRDRAHAVLLASKGYAVPEIADILDRNRETVGTWLKRWNEIRMASIFPEYEGNTNAAKLTEEQKQEIQKTLENPPENGGLPSGFWSVKSLKEYLSATYGVVYESERSYHHLFTMSGYSFKLPDGLNRRRNDELVKRRMAQIVQEIEQKQKEGYALFAADECSLCFSTTLRRAWIKTGEKTIIRTESEKKRQHYFGALNLVSGKHELIALDWQDTANITEALRELSGRYPQQKLCVVWDNARWHRSKELQKLLGKGNEFEHIRLIWLPPYAPDENPEEHVWKIGKDAASNTVTPTFDGLKHTFESAVSNRYFKYQIRGFDLR